MNFCLKCGQPIGGVCPLCASGEPDLLLGAMPVKAMRVFVVNMDTLILHSLNSGRALNGMGEAWIPGETKTARCARVRIRFVNNYGEIEIPNDPFHDAPVWGCSCGIWSCKSREALAKTVPIPSRATALKNKQNGWRSGKYNQTIFVSAQVNQWGKVIEHDWGYRSQHARIIPESIQVYPRNIKTTRDKRLVQTLRGKYSQ